MLGNKISASDGLSSSSTGKLYITAIEQAGVYVVDNEKNLREVQAAFSSLPNETVSQNRRHQVVASGNTSQLNLASMMSGLAQDDQEMLWPDTIGISNSGYLYFVSNNLCHWMQGDLDFTKTVNFRVWRVYMGGQSYTHGCT
jgi:hypothetical protein